MKFGSLLVIAAAVLVTGCASVQKTPKEASAQSKQFSPPNPGNAGLYVYRDTMLGAALKKDVWIDGRCLGETGPYVFFHTEVEGGKTHKISTESEFSPNDLEMMFEPGKNYYLRQNMKWGVFVHGAVLRQVPEEQAKAAIAKLAQAAPGRCSGPR